MRLRCALARAAMLLTRQSSGSRASFGSLSQRAMADDVATLFDEYAERYVRGDHPDPREYLTRAGDGADELGQLIDRFVGGVPPPAASEERVSMMNAWLVGEPPLLALRTERGMRRAE